MASKLKGWLPKPTWKAVEKQRGPVRVLERGRAWLQQLEVSISGVSLCLFLVNLSSRYVQLVGIDGLETPNWANHIKMSVKLWVILEHIHYLAVRMPLPCSGILLKLALGVQKQLQIAYSPFRESCLVQEGRLLLSGFHCSSLILTGFMFTSLFFFRLFNNPSKP